VGPWFEIQYQVGRDAGVDAQQAWLHHVLAMATRPPGFGGLSRTQRQALAEGLMAAVAALNARLDEEVEGGASKHGSNGHAFGALSPHQQLWLLAEVVAGLLQPHWCASRLCCAARRATPAHMHDAPYPPAPPSAASGCCRCVYSGQGSPGSRAHHRQVASPAGLHHTGTAPRPTRPCTPGLPCPHSSCWGAQPWRPLVWRPPQPSACQPPLNACLTGGLLPWTMQ
jgi:hypothetical protein